MSTRACGVAHHKSPLQLEPASYLRCHLAVSVHSNGGLESAPLMAASGTQASYLSGLRLTSLSMSTLVSLLIPLPSSSRSCATQPTAGLIPHLVTISRASRVADAMSDDAPDVTSESPKMSSSATRPPMQTSSLASICLRDMLVSSESGSCATMPSAEPRGTMVALWTGWAPEREGGGEGEGEVYGRGKGSLCNSIRFVPLLSEQMRHHDSKRRDTGHNGGLVDVLRPLAPHCSRGLPLKVPPTLHSVHSVHTILPGPALAVHSILGSD